MTGIEGLLTGSATAGIGGAGVWAIYLVFRAVQTRSDAGTATVTDAASANAALLSTVQSLQTENARLQARVGTLESQVAHRDDRIAEMSVRLGGTEDELAELRKEVRRLQS